MLLAVLMISAKALAYDFEVDGICYNILSETTCKVAYKNFSEGHYEGSVTIPEQVTYNGITRVVTAIGDFAFNGCENLTNIDIPNSVTTIDSYAFLNCTNLKSVSIPNSVTTIGIEAFSGCISLTNIDIPNSVTTINNNAFQNCTNLKSISIPNSITKIFPNTFKGCPNLRGVAFENGEEELEVNSQAFEGCPVEKLYLGRNLTCPESSDPSLCNLTTLADVTIGSLVTDVTAIDWTKNENLKSIHLLSPTPPTSNSFSSSQF